MIAAKPEFDPLELPKGRMFLGYQTKAQRLFNTTSLLLIPKSRQVGITWAFAFTAMKTAAASKQAGGMDVYYISYSKEMTRGFIDDVAMWARAINDVVVQIDEVVFDDDGKDIQAFRIRFASGKSVTALPSVPRSIRSKKGLLIIDEAAFVKDLKELIKAAMAFLVWGGKVVIISTHDGVDNPFNLLIEDIKAGRRKGKVFKITFQDALNDDLYERIMLVTRKKASPAGKLAWVKDMYDYYGEDADEELDVKPSAGSGSWISPADIAAACHDEAGEPRFYAGGLCYVGRDIARRNDLATISPFEDVDGVLWQREEVAMKNARFSEQAAEFDRIMRDYNVVRAALDQTGMGEAVVEAAQDKHGEHLVEGVLFTPTMRLNIATLLKKRFEDGTIRIPNDDKVKADFRSIKKISGGNGAPRIAEDGSSDGHADRFWAAALAVGAAENPYQKYEYKPVPSGAGRGDEGSGGGRGVRGHQGAL